jgi:Short C-terminal domain
MRARAGRRTRGLARTMGRTAVIAGTAQAVTGRVAMRQHASASKHATRTQAARPKMLTDEIVDQLKKLAELRDVGVLTEKEFAAKKAKLLS